MQLTIILTIIIKVTFQLVNNLWTLWAFLQAFQACVCCNSRIQAPISRILTTGLLDGFNQATQCTGCRGRVDKLMQINPPILFKHNVIVTTTCVMYGPESTFLRLFKSLRRLTFSRLVLKSSCPDVLCFVILLWRRMRVKRGVCVCALTHSARSGEVSALHHALPHLAAEQADTHTLQVLRGDLQKHSRPLEL